MHIAIFFGFVYRNFLALLYFDIKIYILVGNLAHVQIASMSN